MTGISGATFVAWALPISVAFIVIGIAVLNHYSDDLERWGKKHIHKK